MYVQPSRGTRQRRKGDLHWANGITTQVFDLMRAIGATHFGQGAGAQQTPSVCLYSERSGTGVRPEQGGHWHESTACTTRLLRLLRLPRPRGWP